MCCKECVIKSRSKCLDCQGVMPQVLNAKEACVKLGVDGNGMEAKWATLDKSKVSLPRAHTLFLSLFLSLTLLSFFLTLFFPSPSLTLLLFLSLFGFPPLLFSRARATHARERKLTL